MIFRILFFLFLTIELFSDGIYDSNLLDIQAKVYPKVIIFDKDIKNKTLKDKIVLTILYDQIDYNTALILKDTIEANYKKLKKIDFLVNLQQINNFKKEKPLSTAYYFILGDKNKIGSIAHFLALNNRLTFCYNDNYLKNGVIVGLKINAQIDLFLNLKALKKSKIDFEESIFNLVKLR